MPDPTIRLLAPDDAPAYSVLRREMLGDSPLAFAASESSDIGVDAAQMAARLREPYNAVVGAFLEEQLVGAAGLVRNRHPKMAHRASIWGVYASPRARGRGVAEAVMRSVIDVARSWPGVNSVGLSVSVQSVAAKRLYERLGFVAWGLEPAALQWEGAAYDEVHMCLRFAPS